jgi:phosphate-selective porin OprO/OprP
MASRFGHRIARWPVLGVALLVGGATASAQTPELPTPANPQPTVPPVPAAGPTREAQLEDRIRQLESMVNQLSTQMQAVSAAAGPDQPAAAGPDQPSPGVGGVVLPNIAPGATAPSNVPSAATAVAPSRSGGVGAPGQSLPPNPPPINRFNSPATLESIAGNIRFGPGFEVRTDDSEFIFQFHDLTQFEYRGYLQGGQPTARDTFALPRQWWIFSGRVGIPFGYFVSLQNGFDNVSGLDMFGDVDYDPRLRFRLGRYKTPFTYEFFVEPVQGLTVPERSVFFNNFGQNRDLGAMAFGRVFRNQIDYAVGLFNGNRNGFLANQNGKFVSSFITWRPFGEWEESLVENFNVGGSVFAGTNQQPTDPQTLRTIVPTAGNAILGVPFLGFNNNVREQGFMAMWDLHVAWFYKQWEFIGEWGSGKQSYGFSNVPTSRVPIPVQSFYLQTSYLLTGETRSGVGIVKPNSPFDIRKGKRGTGAWEPYFRYEYLDISNQVFTQGFADQNLWANRLFQTHTGINWHLTQYIKLNFDWAHAEFNQPVIFSPGRRQLTSNTFLLRFQIYF